MIAMGASRSVGCNNRRALHRIFAPPILPDAERSASLVSRLCFCQSGGMVAHLPSDGVGAMPFGYCTLRVAVAHGLQGIAPDFARQP